MSAKEDFTASISGSYSFKGDSILLGTAIFDKVPINNLQLKIPLKTLNRHGLIAGATGTGKTKTIQVIAERLSEKSIPVLLMDVKGDLSGIAQAGTSNPSIEDRQAKIGEAYQPKGAPVELLSISDQKGVRMRATVSEFGPVLFSKVLELNDTQAGIVALLFKYADDNKLPILDLKDFKKLLQYSTGDGKNDIEALYGKISTTSTGTILRKIIELEQQHADLFFGEKSFEVDDLMRINDEGRGYISILRLNDIQDRPKLFSTFMLSLLAEIYSTFPEEGDPDMPKLVIFIDEAHLIFNEASKALLDQIETIIKLIRSKGVGVIFCTQNPTDIPASVLSQLGLKIQHALRAFTANDRKMIKLTAENYPISDFYKTDELITSLGIGEAALTVLDEKGKPTALAAVLLCAPKSRMDVLAQEEIDKIVNSSSLVKKYNDTVDRDSAYEMLNAKIKSAADEKGQTIDTETGRVTSPTKEEKSSFEKVISSPLAKQVGRTAVREIARGLLGVLGLGGTTRRR